MHSMASAAAEKNLPDLTRDSSLNDMKNFDAASMCSSPSSVKIRNTFLHFENESPRNLMAEHFNDLDLSHEELAALRRGTRARSQSDCLGLNDGVKERLSPKHDSSAALAPDSAAALSAGPESADAYEQWGEEEGEDFVLNVEFDPPDAAQKAKHRSSMVAKHIEEQHALHQSALRNTPPQQPQLTLDSPNGGKADSLSQAFSPTHPAVITANELIASPTAQSYSPVQPPAIPLNPAYTHLLPTQGGQVVSPTHMIPLPPYVVTTQGNGVPSPTHFVLSPVNHNNAFGQMGSPVHAQPQFPAAGSFPVLGQPPVHLLTTPAMHGLAVTAAAAALAAHQAPPAQFAMPKQPLAAHTPSASSTPPQVVPDKNAKKSRARGGSASGGMYGGVAGSGQQYYNGDHMKETDKTTMMLRNIPNKYTQRMLLDRINEMGFTGTFDFFYLPIDLRNKCNVGYAFINFLEHTAARLFMEKLSGVRLTGFNSQKICEVSYAKVQGLHNNIQHYKASPVSGVSQPEYRPLLFAQGVEIPFPVKDRKDSAQLP